MNVSAPQQKIDASRLPIESLANNKALTEDQKVGEASRQFEAILLQQFLSESQKPVVTSEFTDNSAVAGIYQDFITNQLADSLSRGGGIGLAKSFQRQLTHAAPQRAAAPLAGSAGNPAVPAEHAAALLKTGTPGQETRATKTIPHP